MSQDMIKMMDEMREVLDKVTLALEACRERVDSKTPQYRKIDIPWWEALEGRWLIRWTDDDVQRVRVDGAFFSEGRLWLSTWEESPDGEEGSRGEPILPRNGIVTVLERIE